MADKVTGEAADALRRLEDCSNHHRTFVESVDKRYRAYRGIMEKRSRAARWTHKVAPPYINHIVETTLASLIDDDFRFRVRPRAKMYEPGEFTTAAQGAKALEILMRFQLEQARFDEAQRPFALQNAIAGLTVGKIQWRTSYRKRRHLVTEQQVIGEDHFGMPVAVPVLKETESLDAAFDGPCFEVVDVRDFFWDEAAISLEKASFVAHRVYMTKAELQQCAKHGQYENVDDLSDLSGGSDENSTRERDVNGADRTKGRHEVLELYWRTENGIRTCTLGDRKVVLKQPREFPYWHGEYPFVVCSTQPDLFRIPGMSQVEKIMALQEALWDVMNQRLDNLEFVNNAMAIVQEGFDYDAWRHEPGAVNEAPDPANVQMWAPNPIPAEVSLGAEALFKGDMQNLAQAFPFSNGTESQTVDQKTATGASIVTSLAQRSVGALKRQLYLAYERMGQQFLELSQQYVREPVWVNVVGVDSQAEFEEIVPEILQGQFSFTLEPMTESLMRQEKRAEAMAKFQTLMQAVPAFAAMQLPLNPYELAKDFLESYDDQEIDRFFSATPQPGVMGQGQPGQGAPGGTPNGVTAPQSIDPAVSPSNQVSMAIPRAEQRMAALGGGASGGPNAG